MKRELVDFDALSEHIDVVLLVVRNNLETGNISDVIDTHLPLGLRLEVIDVQCSRLVIKVEYVRMFSCVSYHFDFSES